jgi:hypothetical protein
MVYDHPELYIMGPTHPPPGGGFLGSMIIQFSHLSEVVMGRQIHLFRLCEVATADHTEYRPSRIAEQELEQPPACQMSSRESDLYSTS